MRDLCCAKPLSFPVARVTTVEVAGLMAVLLAEGEAALILAVEAYRVDVQTEVDAIARTPVVAEAATGQVVIPACIASAQIAAQTAVLAEATVRTAAHSPILVQAAVHAAAEPAVAVALAGAMAAAGLAAHALSPSSSSETTS